MESNSRNLRRKIEYFKVSESVVFFRLDFGFHVLKRLRTLSEVEIKFRGKIPGL